MDIHILTQAQNQKTINCIFHIPIPATGSNTASISWRDAMVKEQGGASNIQSVLPDITTEEDSALKAGAIVEVSCTVRFSSLNLTNAERLQEIKNQFNDLKAQIVAEKQIELDFMGFKTDAV